MRLGRTIIATVWGASVLAGCAPTWLPKPEGWPEMLAGRALYVTSRSYIYASSPSAAKEIDDVVREAASEFAARTGAAHTATVIVVVDADDPLPFSDARDMFAAMSTAEARREGKPEPDVHELERMLRAILRDVDQANLPSLPLDLMLTSKTIILDADTAERSLGLPRVAARQAGRALVMPTRRRIDRFVGATLDIVLKRMSPGLRIILWPMLARPRAREVDAVAKQRQASVLEAFVELQSGWSAEKKKRIIAAYREAVESSAGPGTPLPDSEPTTAPTSRASTSRSATVPAERGKQAE